MSIAQLRCGRCSGELGPDDRFCGTCGSPAPAPASDAFCPDCGATALWDDRSCAACTPSQAPRSRRRPRVRCRSRRGGRRVPRLWRRHRPAAAPPRGLLRTCYGSRRGQRKRSAVVVAASDDTATLLFESGEMSVVSVAELPDPAGSPVPVGTLFGHADAARRATEAGGGLLPQSHRDTGLGDAGGGGPESGRRRHGGTPRRA
jgi:Double zinc ribbon